MVGAQDIYYGQCYCHCFHVLEKWDTKQGFYPCIRSCILHFILDNWPECIYLHGSQNKGLRKKYIENSFPRMLGIFVSASNINKYVNSNMI